MEEGILFDGANTQNNVPKAMKCENEKEHFDVEGEVIKVELKMESGNDSETVVNKRISAELEVLNVDKTAKSFEIKPEMKNIKIRMKKMKLDFL